MTTTATGTASLVGRRIGFYTSVVGMGGSEVLVADAMEAASGAGARVVCWSDPAAAIRRVTAARCDRLRVEHRDWPAAAIAPMTIGECKSVPVARSTRSVGLKGVVRGLVPFVVKRYAGFRRTAKAFQSELRAVAPDVLFVNVNGSEAVSLAGPMCGVPVVNCYHLSLTRSPGGPLMRWGDGLARRATLRAGALTVHTSAVVRDQWCHAYGYPADRVRLIYNGVDPRPLPDRGTKRAELGLSAGDFAFCVPGRLDPMKGHADLIAAVALRRESLTNAVFLVCGAGNLRDALERQAAAAGVAHLFRFLGWRTDLPEVLHAADCTVLPSTESENLSVAVLEGLMAGTPAVVTRVGGMAEAVLDGQTGLVIEPMDPPGLGAALARLVADRELARRFGEAAGHDARERFIRTRMIRQYQELFAEMTMKFCSPRLAERGE